MVKISLIYYQTYVVLVIKYSESLIVLCFFLYSPLDTQFFLLVKLHNLGKILVYTSFNSDSYFAR